MVLLLLVFAVAAAGGALAGLTAGGVGGGPAAMAAAVYIVALFASAILGLVGLGLPLGLLAGASLAAALLAGYRHLRWIRYLGVTGNLLGIAYFIFLHYFAEIEALTPLLLLLALPAANIALFLLLPRRPNLALTRRLAAIAQPCLFFLSAAAILLAMLTNPPKFSVGANIFLLVVALLYALPFAHNYLTLPLAANPPTRRLAWKLGLSLVLTVLTLLLVFPLGLPLTVATVALFGVAEHTILNPGVSPEPDGAYYWLVRCLGRLPESEPFSPTSKN